MADSRKMPAGRYIVGDPCYNVSHREWSTNLYLDFELGEYAKFQKDGTIVEVVAFKTAHGDGIYADNYGNQYPVDSGMIGIMSAELFDPENISKATHILVFPNPFRARMVDGVITFGHVVIRTDGENDHQGGEDEYPFGMGEPN